MPTSRKEEAHHNVAAHAADMVAAETTAAAEIAVVVETIVVVVDAETTVEDLKTEAAVKIVEDMSVANVVTKVVQTALDVTLETV
jgi:hypothetical protein